MSERVSLLMCAYRGLSTATHMSLVNAVSVLGWRHRIVTDDALLDHARGMLVSAWYRETSDDVFVMIDDDIVFTPADVQRLVGHELDAVSAAYPARLGQTLTGIPVRPDQDASVLESGSLIPLWRAGMGCIAVRRTVIDALVNTMWECDRDIGQPFWPLFMPMIRNNSYVGEDGAFSMRVIEAGFKIWLDPAIRVAHLSSGLPVTMENMNLVRDAYDSRVPAGVR